MLEKATACLKNAARDSLQCARQHQVHYQRKSLCSELLHQTFWTHGAGDLSLLFYAASASSVPAHSQCRNQRADSRPRKSRERSTQPTPLKSSDSPFLDFLYPPQALAWLQRADIQQHDPRNKRNTRRTARGLVRASRNYSSAAYTPMTRTDNGSIDAIGATKGSSTNSMGRHVEKAITTMLGGSKQQGQASAPLEEQGKRFKPVGEGFADSPGDLAEIGRQEVQHGSVQALQKLRSLLAGKGSSVLPPEKNETSYAWALFTSLAEDDKQDVRLKNILMTWLAARQDEVANAHCISLYWALPMEARSLSTYQAALTAHVRRKDDESALAVHHEALRNIPNGDQITKAFFRYALQNRQWDLALAIKDQHHNTFPGTEQSRRNAIFWLYVGEIPDLATIAAQLVLECRKLKKEARLREEARTAHVLMQLSARLSQEAILQLSQAPLPSLAEMQSLKLPEVLSTLCAAINTNNPESAHKLLEEALLGLLRHHTTPGYRENDEFALAFPVLSVIYNHYRETKHFAPSEFMLQAFLDGLLQIWMVPPKATPVVGLTVGRLLEDWKKAHGKLSKSGIHSLMDFHAHAGHVERLTVSFRYLKENYPQYADQRDILWTLIHVYAQRGDVALATRAFGKVQKLALDNADTVNPRWWTSLLQAHTRADDLKGAFTTFEKMLAAGVVASYYQFIPVLKMLAKRGDVRGAEKLLKEYDALTGEPRHTPMIAHYLTALMQANRVPDAEKYLKETVAQQRNQEVLGELTSCFNAVLDGHAHRKHLDATMRVFQLMKDEGVPTNSYTYGSLMLVLCSFRQSEAARELLVNAMPREGLKQTPRHFAIVMNGLIEQRMQKDAIELHDLMRKNGVMSSLASNKVYLKALAFDEQRYKHNRTLRENGPPDALTRSMEVLQKMVKKKAISDNVAAVDETYQSTTDDLRNADLVSSLINVHGSRHCFDAVEELFDVYRRESHAQGKADACVPMQILAAYMKAMFYKKRYQEVEEFWKLAKSQADIITAPILVPDLATVKSSSQIDIPDGPDGIEAAEIMPHDVPTASQRAGPQSSDSSVTQGAHMPVPQADLSPASGLRPVAGLSRILTVAVRYYFRALIRQGRELDLVRTWNQLLSQGYTFDNMAWNRVVEYLCNASPPLALTAFKLMERFLIPNVPDWAKHTPFVPRNSEIDLSYQYLKTRYNDDHRVLTPNYRTLLHLASALVKLRRMETSGDPQLRDTKIPQRLIGRVSDIAQQAPITYNVVQSIPTANDQWQKRMFSSGDQQDGW